MSDDFTERRRATMSPVERFSCDLRDGFDRIEEKYEDARRKRRQAGLVLSVVLAVALDLLKVYAPAGVVDGIVPAMVAWLVAQKVFDV